MNRVDLIGRLTRDPELRYAQTGTAITRFTVAVNRRLSKEKRQELEAQGKPTADFISCQAFGNTAELIANYFSKGNLIGIEGSIQTGSYEKDGQTVYTTEVNVYSCDFLEKNDGGLKKPQQSNNAGEVEGYFPINNEDLPF